MIFHWKPPGVPFLRNCDFFKRYYILMFLGWFCQLIAFSVSAVASSWIFAVRRATFLAQELSGKVRGGQNWCVEQHPQNTFAKNGTFANILRPLKLANVTFSYIFDTNYCIFDTKGTFASFGLNFSQKLANVPPGQNVGKRTRPKVRGAFETILFLKKTNYLLRKYDCFVRKHNLFKESQLLKRAARTPLGL